MLHTTQYPKNSYSKGLRRIGIIQEKGVDQGTEGSIFVPAPWKPVSGRAEIVVRRRP